MDLEFVSAANPDAALSVVSVAEQRAHMRIASVSRDADIEAAVRDAVAELHGPGGELRRSVTPARWKMYLPEFPGDYTVPIEIPLPPLQSVIGITYMDADGATQTLNPSVYTVSPGEPVGHIHLVYGKDWPATFIHPRSIAITFDAGYDWSGAHPHLRQIKRAVKVLAAHLYENAEATIIDGRITNSSKKVEFGLDFLLDRLRVPLRYD